jgi:hypothetical protein
MSIFSLRVCASGPLWVAATLWLAVAGAAAQAPAAVASYVGRPVYSEPGAGLQMPPGCQIEPSWRGRMGNSDLEVWIVACDGETRTWAVRRTTIEMVAANQARLRFQVTDERRWPGETAGESVSVQCVGRNANDSGFVVAGAKWKPAGNELRLTSATAVLRVDPATQKFIAATLAQVDCVRYPEREAMMRRLQKG